ncbi:ABC transporter ATP-binding protein [uncultured Tenacibaculum sp.]|uniref:ABC transporter ATP-binding protein n=1 Tax=uncultured Tenacibaculum sp. TaxID=174713 RepID=UPI002629F126|nr:ABC transporter ATP-binding protein [uncultured Tenacibaculum sp.]
MLQVNNITFSYSEKKKILKNISLKISEGEHLSVMGESGCGKSTLLKVIYGLLDLDEGNIFWKDQEVLGPAYHLVPGMDFFKYVPQNFDLMPYITVAENISKFLSRFYPEESERRTNELLDVIEMKAYANEKVKNLSGGQQQRVAIAKALAKEPELLLLDEPFSQIDNFKKNALRRNLFSYLKKNKIACIVATHDGNDALSFSDQLIVIQHNKIIASGTPSELYQKRNNKYVAALFDDVNEVVINNETKLFYPHQIKFVEDSEFKVKVLKNYFKGFYWLVEVAYDSQSLFIASEFELEVRSERFINFRE